MVNGPTQGKLDPRVNDKPTTNVPSATGAANGGDMATDKKEQKKMCKQFRQDLTAKLALIRSGQRTTTQVLWDIMRNRYIGFTLGNM